MNPAAILKQIHESEACRNLTVIGETLLDDWRFGEVTRKNPEQSDSMVFSVTDSFKQSGGAAGMVRCLDALIPELHKTLRFHTNFSYITHKVRYASESSGKILFRADHDNDVPQLQPLSQTNLKQIIISDYGKGFLNWGVLCDLACRWHSPGQRIIFSPHIRNCRTCTREIMGKLKHWLWVLNDEECHALPTEPQLCIKTQGSAPVLYRNEPMRIYHSKFPHEKVDSIHACAMGDVFLASFSAGHIAGAQIPDAIEFGISCCKLVLKSGRKGTHYLAREDLDAWDTRTLVPLTTQDKAAVTELVHRAFPQPLPEDI